MVEPLHLREADGGLEVRHAVVVARDDVPIAAAFFHPVIAEDGHAFHQLRVVCRHHATFACGDDFVGEKREATDITNCPDFSPAILRAESFGGVFHHEDAVLSGDSHNRVHVARMAVEMHRHDGLCARRDFTLEVRWIKRPRIARHVGEHRLCAEMDDDIRAGGEGEVRHDDFIARPDAERGEREVERGGAVRDAERITNIEELTK